MASGKAKQTPSNSKKIPRPMNCFLAYRLEKQSEIVARCPGANHRDISKIIAKWWKEASEEEKAPYRERARIAKIEHARMYPNYKYTPQKKGSKRRYTVRPKDKFTSRNEANNQIMQLLYNNPGALQYVPPLTTDLREKQIQPLYITTDTTNSGSSNGSSIGLSITPPSPAPFSKVDDPTALQYPCSSSATIVSSPYSSRGCSPSSPEHQALDTQHLYFTNTCDWNQIQQHQQSNNQYYELSNIYLYQTQYNMLYTLDNFQPHISECPSTHDASMQSSCSHTNAWALDHPPYRSSQYSLIPSPETNLHASL